MSTDAIVRDPYAGNFIAQLVERWYGMPEVPSSNLGEVLIFLSIMLALTSIIFCLVYSLIAKPTRSEVSSLIL